MTTISQDHQPSLVSAFLLNNQGVGHFAVGEGQAAVRCLKRALVLLDQQVGNYEDSLMEGDVDMLLVDKEAEQTLSSISYMTLPGLGMEDASFFVYKQAILMDPAQAGLTAGGPSASSASLLGKLNLTTKIVLFNLSLVCHQSVMALVSASSGTFYLLKDDRTQAKIQKSCRLYGCCSQLLEEGACSTTTDPFVVALQVAATNNLAQIQLQFCNDREQARELLDSMGQGLEFLTDYHHSAQTETEAEEGTTTRRTNAFLAPHLLQQMRINMLTVNHMSNSIAKMA